MAITTSTITKTVTLNLLSSANDFIITEALVIFFAFFFPATLNNNYWNHNNLSKRKGCKL